MDTTYKAREPEGEARRKAALGAAWERRRKNVAARIEDAALALCLERGFEAVAVDDIVAAAGISKRSFYRYYESPGDIIHAILNRSNDVWAQAFRERPLDEPILASFHAAFAYVEGAPEQVPGLRRALDVIGRSREAWMRMSGPAHAYSTRTFREILVERMIAKGQNPRPAGAIAAAITAMLIYLGEESIAEGRPDNGEDFQNAIKAFQKILEPGG